MMFLESSIHVSSFAHPSFSVNSLLEELFLQRGIAAMLGRETVRYIFHFGRNDSKNCRDVGFPPATLAL
jgi:hypothetical protein